MTTQVKCDVCSRSAKYHDTSFNENVVEQHLCGVHGRTLFLGAMKDVLSSQLKHVPSGGRSTRDTDSQLKERIANASSLSEIDKLFRLGEMAASLRPGPPMA